MTLTHGSLFTGIGGIDLGFERAGIETIWQVEIDDYARRVLEKHWPGVERHADIRECGAGNLARPDIISGGFPCQDISVAGKGAGLRGSRSGLWAEMRRVIKECRPRWVVVENVYRGWRRWVPFVRCDLSGAGYDSVPFRLRASDFGLFHQRARAFVVANNDGQLCDWRERLPQAAAETGRLLTERDHAIAADLDRARELQSQGRKRKERGWLGHCSPPDGCVWVVEPCMGGNLYGVPAAMDRRRCLGNAVVPDEAEWIGRRIVTSLEGKHE